MSAWSEEATREVVRRVLARLGDGEGSGPRRAPVDAALPPELRGTHRGRWDEPHDDTVGVTSPTMGPDAGRCRGCQTAGLCTWVCSATTNRLLWEGADRVGATVGARATPPGVAGRIDHTLLAAETTAADIERLCDEALRYRFASVCVNGHWVPRVAERLRGTDVRTCAVVGFPLGATDPGTKAEEAALAVEEGADEIDMVMQIGLLKSRDYALVLSDIKGVVASGVPVKVILETALLTDEEKRKAAALAQAAGAAFVKTSTGFGPSGATVADVRLLRSVVGEGVSVKASGGIRDADVAQAMIEAGADRIGASASVRIVEESKAS